MVKLDCCSGLGKIPTSCIVAGTGNGKLWKFYRVRIDAWIKKR